MFGDLTATRWTVPSCVVNATTLVSFSMHERNRTDHSTFALVSRKQIGLIFPDDL